MIDPQPRADRPAQEQGSDQTKALAGRFVYSRDGELKVERKGDPAGPEIDLRRSGATPATQP